MSSQVAVDSIYSALLEEYLSAFVPISGVVPMPQYAGHPWNPPSTPSSPTVTPSRKVSLYYVCVISYILLIIQYFFIFIKSQPFEVNSCMRVYQIITSDFLIT